MHLYFGTHACLKVFTDILAGFTFYNRVLRLPAIVLLNTMFRPGNSGLLRFGSWQRPNERESFPTWTSELAALRPVQAGCRSKSTANRRIRVDTYGFRPTTLTMPKVQ